MATLQQALADEQDPAIDGVRGRAAGLRSRARARGHLRRRSAVPARDRAAERHEAVGQGVLERLAVLTSPPGMHDQPAGCPRAAAGGRCRSWAKFRSRIGRPAEHGEHQRVPEGDPLDAGAAGAWRTAGSSSASRRGIDLPVGPHPLPLLRPRHGAPAQRIARSASQRQSAVGAMALSMTFSPTSMETRAQAATCLQLGDVAPDGVERSPFFRQPSAWSRPSCCR